MSNKAKKKTSAADQNGMVIHIPVKTHNRLKLHTLLKQTKNGSKLTIAQEADQAIKKYIDSQGFV